MTGRQFLQTGGPVVRNSFQRTPARRDIPCSASFAVRARVKPATTGSAPLGLEVTYCILALKGYRSFTR